MYEKCPKRSVCLRGRKGWSVPKHSALIRSPTRIMFWLTEHLTQCRCVCAVTLCVFEHVVRIILKIKKVEVYPFKDTTQSGMTQLYTPFFSTRKKENLDSAWKQVWSQWFLKFGKKPMKLFGKRLATQQTISILPLPPTKSTLKI